MVSTRPEASSTTPVPSRLGPSVWAERAPEDAVLRSFTTDSESTVRCSVRGRIAGGSVRPSPGAAAAGTAHRTLATTAHSTAGNARPRGRMGR